METNGGAGRQYLLFAWSPAGYELREREGEPPEVGSELDDEGRRLVVTKIGPPRSPATRGPAPTPRAGTSLRGGAARPWRRQFWTLCSVA